MKYSVLLLVMIIGTFFIISGCQKENISMNNPAVKVDEGKGDSKDGKEADKEKPNNQAKEKVILENEAFRVVAPVPNQKVDGMFIVEGKARVFEASFQYKLEDGHNVLAQGHVMASKGAPEWGDFKFEIHYSGATSPHAVLILFEGSPKDGSPQHELSIPLKIENYE